MEFTSNVNNCIIYMQIKYIDKTWFAFDSKCVSVIFFFQNKAPLLLLLLVFCSTYFCWYKLMYRFNIFLQKDQ